jgi:TRAP-type mannitol/chloroaromatic compound transport system permease large subunit
LTSFVGELETLILFFMVMGAIFFGIFTPIEAAAAGAFLTLLIAIIRRQLTWGGFIKSIASTTRINCIQTILKISHDGSHFAMRDISSLLLDAYEHPVAGKVWTPLQHQSAL